MDVGGSVEFARVVVQVARIKPTQLPSTREREREFYNVTKISISGSGQTCSQETNHNPLPTLSEDRLAHPTVSRNAAL